MTYKFVDELPKDGKGRPGAAGGKYAGFARALRRNPGRWAAFPNSKLTARSAATYRNIIKHGLGLGFEGGGYEAAVRQGILYVRHAGGGQ